MSASTESAVHSASRDWKVVGLVGGGHFFSHFYMLVLPPLFPILKLEFGVGYAALGLLITVFEIAAGFAQIPAGFLVDRIGARPVLLGGLGLLAGGIGLIALAPSYGVILALMIAAGIGNSVFHPADYAIMSASIHQSRIGRAYGMHNIAGNIGWALVPGTIILFTTLWSWRAAIAIVAIFGLAYVVVLMFQSHLLRDERDHAPAPVAAGGSTASKAGGLGLLLSAPMLVLFVFFAVNAMANSSVRTFSVTALVTNQDMPLASANGALTGYLIATAIGVFLGGIIVDRLGRTNVVAGLGFLAAAAMAVWIGTGSLGLVALAVVLSLCGFFQGITRPARDMMVRAVTPRGSTGKVFAFVSTGLNLGGAIMPVVLGWIIDRGRADLVFWLIGAFLLAAFATVIVIRRMSPASAT